MRSTSPVAYLDPQRQIVAIDARSRAVPLTAPPGLLWASFGGQSAEDIHSWPCWSPDGRRIAAWRAGRAGGPVRVFVCDEAGVSSLEGPALEGRVPIYLQWSRDSSKLAMLSQGKEALSLDVAPVSDLEQVESLLSGVPLFFSWLPGGRIAAFVGERAGPALVVFGPDGTRSQMPGLPGNFCAPVPVGDDLVYVAQHRGHITILTSRPPGLAIRELEIVDGLVALVGDPEGRTVARAVAPDGDSPYRDLRVIDPRTGATRGLSDADCQAFFWAGSSVVVARRHPSRGSVVWLRVTLDGREEQLAELYPSRDLRFWLRFFEQYSGSHRIVDREGTTLLLSGSLAGRADPESPPRIWAVPIQGGPAEEIAEGPFATFGPPRA